MELGEPKSFRVIDDHEICVGNVNTHFDDRGCHQNVERMVTESLHDVGLFLRI